MKPYSSPTTKHKQGICPICGSKALEYDAANFEGNVVMYPVKCLDCEMKADECYYMKFIEHENIIKKGE